MRVIAVGDSIAAGIGDAPVDGRLGAWSGRLAAVSRGSHMNLAVPGARIGMVQRIQVPAALLARPQVVLISVGGNDVVDRRFELRRFADELSRSLNMIEAAGCGAVLLTVADWSTSWPMPRRLQRGFRRRIDQVNEAIRNGATDTGAQVIDRTVHDSLQARECLHPDRVHLSPRGYQRLARITAEILGLEAASLEDEVQMPVTRTRLRASHVRPLLKRTPDLAGLLLAYEG